ncbi:amino acid ABC transporter permease [Microlunatus sp. Gsoil 973]|uniref:amino acid ABC transporter permease n=1 Tax=Microlunatus sp. Gsoil 973 TaxID=2672569 RepID=UPI0012B4A7BC|nr:amino acid ABC transporter permease [Microlunatus sp. Gsoil 973]QGN33047.1 ABC transporter permease subunit [Microlunatus sp. Gsoil 973]
MGQLAELISKYHVALAFWMTIKLTVFGGLGALIIGTLVAIFRVAPINVLRWIGTGYVNIIRNTPLTLIVFFFAFGVLNTLNISLADQQSPTSIADNNFRWGVVALSVYHASFVAEALRSGVNTVPQGQAEAARAIGLSFLPSLTQIILPQAFRGAIAPLGNTLVALTKNTTVVSTIGVAEISYQMKNMIEFSPQLLYAIFLLVAICFVVLTLPVGALFTYLSRRLAVQR